MMIVLVGFMGCGKTVVGRALSRRLQVPFVDLDHEISTSFDAPVADIFSRFGEEIFRKEESRLLERELDHDAGVIAAGGGAFCREENRAAIARAGAVPVFLDVPWEVLVSRLEYEASTRPKFIDSTQAERLYRERYPAYLEARVHLTLTGQESPEDIASRIEQRVAVVA
ncbi:MAG: AAA family ATPase [Acidobacteria bacterium]|nr:AAA family ATPase [Acidobacteriota bacterium]